MSPTCHHICLHHSSSGCFTDGSSSCPGFLLICHLLSEASLSNYVKLQPLPGTPSSSLLPCLCSTCHHLTFYMYGSLSLCPKVGVQNLTCFPPKTPSWLVVKLVSKRSLFPVCIAARPGHARQSLQGEGLGRSNACYICIIATEGQVAATDSPSPQAGLWRQQQLSLDCLSKPEGKR